MWVFEGNRIAVRFADEWHNDKGECSGFMAMKIGSSMSIARTHVCVRVRKRLLNLAILPSVLMILPVTVLLALPKF